MEVTDPAPEETTAKRPLGVTLIAAFFFLKGAALALALAMSQMRPKTLPAAKALAIVAAPITQVNGLKYVLLLAVGFAVVELLFGFGLWYMTGWAWGYLVFFYGLQLAAVPLAMLVGYNPPNFFALTLRAGFSPIHYVIHAFIVVYLLRADVKAAFERSVEGGVAGADIDY